MVYDICGSGRKWVDQVKIFLALKHSFPGGGYQIYLKCQKEKILIIKNAPKISLF